MHSVFSGPTTFFLHDEFGLRGLALSSKPLRSLLSQLSLRVYDTHSAAVLA